MRFEREVVVPPTLKRQPDQSKSATPAELERRLAGLEQAAKERDEAKMRRVHQIVEQQREAALRRRRLMGGGRR